MIASSWWKAGIGLVSVVGIAAASGIGCSSSTSGGTTSTSSTNGAGGGSTTTGGTTGGTGGDTTTTGATTTGGTTTTSTTSTGSTTSSTGTGTSAYADCSECTALNNMDSPPLPDGAPTHECKTGHDACFGNKNCVQIYNCVYDINNGCTTDAAGACCVYACYDALKATLGNDAVALKTAVDQYVAYDQCLYCTTCKDLCSADAYCTAYAAGPGACN